jgi:hypothetical protein
MNPRLTRAAKTAFGWVALSVVSLGIVAITDSCVPFKTVARGVLDVATATCLVANSDKSDDQIRQICGIVDALDEPMRELLKSSRERVAQERERVAFSKDVECHFRGLQDLKDGGR